MSFCDVLTNPILAGLYNYWRGKFSGDILPSRAAIDPLDLRGFLGRINLIDVLEAPSRFRYRLIGTFLTEIHGCNRTGMVFGDTNHADDPLSSILSGLYSACRDSATAIYSESVSQYKDRPKLEVERLLLPLSSDGQKVDMILAAIDLKKPELMVFAPFSREDLLSIEETVRIIEHPLGQHELTGAPVCGFDAGSLSLSTVEVLNHAAHAGAGTTNLSSPKQAFVEI